jgi:1-deoxy-D-xylulose-5-phosphate synthase
VARKAQAEALPIGKAEILREGRDVAIFGLGNLLPLANELADKLELDGFSASVVNPRFVKPLDLQAIERVAKDAAAVVTFEDHALMGGFGSAVMEALEALSLHVPVVRVGWPDNFIEHGKVDQLRAKYGITAQAAYEKLSPLLAGVPKARLAV